MTKPKAESKTTTKTAAKPAAKVAGKATAKTAPKTTASAKPATVKKQATAAPAKPARAPAARKKAGGGNTVPAEQRSHYVEVAAFYIAERRGFAPGNPVNDWLAAEAEIDALLAQGKLG